MIVIAAEATTDSLMAADDADPPTWLAVRAAAVQVWVKAPWVVHCDTRYTGRMGSWVGWDGLKR